MILAGDGHIDVDVENLELEFVVIAIDNTPDKTPQSLEESL